jgi:hypothetical protein
MGQTSARNGRYTAQQDRTPPVYEIRAGKIKVAIWENKGDKQGTWFSVTHTRSYQDASKTWKTASSYSKDDLLVLAELLRQAWVWIAREQGGAASNVTDDHDDGDGR